MVLGSILGIIQAIFLIAGANPLLNFMGVGSDSPMLTPAKRYLALRSLGAPAVLLSLATQGVFRGFKDTTTPLYATVAGDLTNIILDPIFIFVFRKGVSGAAVAHVISQYLMAGILLWRLTEQVDLIPPSLKRLQFGRFLKNSFLLLIRVIAVTFCVTLSASLAARQGATAMAAFQICLQFWLATSLLADGLAVAGQAILASAFAKKDYDRATASASRVLQLGLVLGLILATLLGVGLHFGARLFSRDGNVLKLISIGIPVSLSENKSIAILILHQKILAIILLFLHVSLLQVLNPSMPWHLSLMVSTLEHLIIHILRVPWQVMVSFVSILCLLGLSACFGFIGLWVGLTIYMSLRAFAGFWRIGTKTGPWEFLGS
ncbi:hypothetical protein JRO89_XS10G0048800 [Xanthoceras sorbifolium]|uniref:Uncharacterized protein n=1 Tax=Xanthoceras sorbifolium TaxID=99658 RepID=A0ABQ8HHM8_9ROSI|nr:hypothetical protein JRO89_XS10G0048800 [Xanthoceras sorbifolium]